MSIFSDVNRPNKEIREAIEHKGLKHFQVAAACGVNRVTFSTWLQLELPKEKKEKILKVIEEMKT